MTPVTVRRLRHEIIRIGDGLRIADERLVRISDIARKDNLLRLSLLREPHLDRRRSEKMADICEADPDPVADINLHVIRARNKVLHDACRVLGRVNRHIRGLSLSLALAVSPLRLEFLNSRRIEQHNLAQVCCGACRKNFSVKALRAEKRQKTRVVNVRVSHKDIIDVRGLRGKRHILPHIPPLLHSVIDQDFLSRRLEVMAASGHLVISSDKCKPHIKRLLPSLPDAARSQIRHLFSGSARPVCQTAVFVL